LKKIIGAFSAALILTSCASQQAATITSEDTVITQADGSKVTVSPSPLSTEEPVATEAGEVVSCRSVRFIEKPAKDLILNCLDGAQGFNVGAIEGPAIINVWGTWCPPCRQELPILVAFDKSRDPSIQLVGVDVEDAPYMQVQPFVIAHGMKYPIFYDADRSSRAYFGMGVPITWFINNDNEVAYKKVGGLVSLKELRTLSQKYLGVS
jgi:thiol-disulfide isomerase/thioredoxin